MSQHTWMPNDVPLDKPSPARMYDYLLGGYHNFEIDRIAAGKVIEIDPEAPLVMRANRAFLRRAVNYLLAQGITQFLDLGSGIPTVGSVHEVAQGVNREARVVYVDVDPVAVRHSEAILAGNPNVTAIQADARQAAQILSHPEVRRLLNFSEPLAVLIVSVLLFVREDEEAHRLVRFLRDALAPGSYIAISHGTYEKAPAERLERIQSLYARTTNPVKLRSHTQISQFFEGLDLVEPGLVYVPLWQPEGADDLFLDQPELSVNFAGIGRKA